MSLELHAVVGARGVDLALDVAEGETLAVLGPNGAGKSTTLAVAAGLLHPDRGHVRLDGRTLHDDRTRVPPHRRGAVLLAQEPRLFPHLSVLDNVAFAPRSAGAGRRRSREAARPWLERADVAALADRRPHELSGGQAQRVALARALAAEPRLLLLDEPLAAVDVAYAPQLRQVLRRVLRDRTALLVTHDVLDALVLADRVVVVEGGRVVEQGPTHDVLTRPRTSFTARIAGLDLVRGTAAVSAAGTSVHTPDGLVVTGTPSSPVEAGAAAVAVFSPAAVAVHRTAPGGSPRNAIPATVTAIEPLGDRVRVRAGALVAEVTAPVVAELDLTPGADVVLVVKATEVAVHPI